MNTTLVCARYNEDLNWLLPLKTESIIIYNKGEDNLHMFPKQKVVKLPNLGREGGTYLHHIIQNYDNLSDYTIFTQANPVDHIWHDNIEKSYKEIFDTFSEKKTYNFKYLSKHFIKVEQKCLMNYTSGMISLGYRYAPPIEIKKIIGCLTKMKDSYPLVKDELLLLINDLNKLKTDIIETYELTKIISKNAAFMHGDDHVKRRESLYSNFDFSFFLNTIGNTYTFGYGAIFVVSKKNIQFYPKSFWETIYSTFQDVKPSAGWGLEKMWRYILSDDYIMLNSLNNIPDLKMSPLKYVMEKMKFLLLRNYVLVWWYFVDSTKYLCVNVAYLKMMLPPRLLNWITRPCRQCF
jgi:hypothetical protein